ncbi:MAG: penicillin-binding protein 1C [Litorimonas sp.]
MSKADLSSTSPVLKDRHGAVLNVRTVETGTWRMAVDVGDIDPAFIDALLFIEDKRFYTHPGVDGAAIIRALGSWKAEGRVVSGASTLTMQLIRQYKPRPRTFKSKVIESLEALRFELHFSKEEILEQYLNRISYGGNIEGIEAASRIYFGKSPRYLSDDEIALLIALPQAPEARRPDRHAQAANLGRRRILKRLEAGGLIDELSASRAQMAAIPLEKKKIPNQAWLSARQLSAEGETVQSWIDPKQQTAVEAHLAHYVERQPKAVNASAILVHAKTREVRAHAAIGRRDHDGGWLDMTAAIRSPGSTLKPFVYGLGMDDGLIGSETRLRDAPSRFGSYRPENFDRRYYGDVTVAQALQHSLNIPAVGVLDHVGGRRLGDTLRAAGARTSQSGPDTDATTAGLALALGGTGLRATDLAMLYTAIANDGVAAPLSWIQTDEEDVSSFELLQPDTARTLKRVLASSPRPKGVMPSHLGKDIPEVAYKTGTSYGFRDSWAAGISGEYVIVVWVGRPDGGPRPGVTGREAAAPLLFKIADGLPDNRTKSQLVARSEMTERLKSAEETAPVILFPLQDTDIFVSKFKDTSDAVDLLVQAEGPNTRVYVDSTPIPKTRNGYRFVPPSPGFYEMKVVDANGAQSKTKFRVLTLDDLSHPGL